MAWFKANSLPSDYPRIISKETKTTADPYSLLISNKSPHRNKVAICIKSDGQEEYVYSRTKITLGKWYHVAGTFDGKIMNIYMNGQFEKSKRHSYTIPSLTTSVLIGNNPKNNRQFDGIIDEVRIYNRALSEDEITDMYNNYPFESNGLLGRTLIRKYVSPEPTHGAYGNEEGSDYDYVLEVVNQVADNWQVKLQAYSNSSISRLSNTTISIRNTTTTSNQIIVSNGTITQTEGPLFNLPGGINQTLYIKMSNVKATTNGISYIYAYLKIQKPNTTTYSLYVITFEIT
ncbi:MAG: hypothetical protein AOA66_0700 [Candidatus Bathyarchaeota archaeon BA2]|nr:MAG: hypothetical protein AOA66_0700 [Candidatus Bathyarchaeota archaeon BA2]